MSVCDQEEVAEFSLGLCCAEGERGETPGREDSPSDLVEADLDPGGDPKTGDDKSLGNVCRDMLPVLTCDVNFTCHSLELNETHVTFLCTSHRMESTLNCLLE